MRFLREPLLHFLLLGAGLFALFYFVNKDSGDEPGRIVVTAGQIQHLADVFTRTWQRPLTKQELEGLIQDYVREEVLYREAIALGLDRDDTVIRRRLRQKMEFMSEDVATQTELSDEELRDYLVKHPEKFRLERSFTFSQVYLNPNRRGDSLKSDVENLLVKLNDSGAKTDIATLGDRFLLEHDFKSATESEISKLFGEKFAAQLSQLEPGRWHGPVESGYGVHLVFIQERAEAHVPPLDEIRDAVLREWENDKRLEAKEKLYQSLLERYTVVVERPEEVSGSSAAAKEAQQ
jgi:hypothetical protein